MKSHRNGKNGHSKAKTIEHINVPFNEGPLLREIETRARKQKIGAGEIIARLCKTGLQNLGKSRQQTSNSVEYRPKDGRHIISLNLGDGAFTALRVVAHSFGHPTPAEYVLSSVCNDAAEMLTQIPAAEAKEFIEWAGADLDHSAQTLDAEHEITLRLSRKAYTILAGEALASGYDSPEHMILAHTSSTCAQSAGDRDQKEYAKMFGLTADGDMILPRA